MESRGREKNASRELLCLIRELRQYLNFQKELEGSIPLPESMSWGSKINNLDILWEGEEERIAALSHEHGIDDLATTKQNKISHTEKNIPMYPGEKGREALRSFGQNLSQKKYPLNNQQRDEGVQNNHQITNDIPFIPDQPEQNIEIEDSPNEIISANKFPPLSILKAEHPSIIEKKQNEFIALQSQWQHCTNCSLEKEREGVVLGSGAISTRLMLVTGMPYSETGEHSSEKSDKEELLIKILKAIGINWEDVYITSIIKCSLKHLRPPKSTEVKACLPLLEKEIELIQPDVIVALGAIAAQTLLKETKRLVRLRGKFHHFQDRYLLPIFSPIHLISRPFDKKTAWLDWQKLRKHLEDSARNS